MRAASVADLLLAAAWCDQYQGADKESVATVAEMLRAIARRAYIVTEAQADGIPGPAVGRALLRLDARDRLRLIEARARSRRGK